MAVFKIERTVVRIIDAIKSIQIETELTVNCECGAGDTRAGVTVGAAGIDAGVCSRHMLQS